MAMSLKFVVIDLVIEDNINLPSSVLLKLFSLFRSSERNSLEFRLPTLYGESALPTEA